MANSHMILHCPKCAAQIEAPVRTFMDEPQHALDKTAVMELASAVARSGSVEAGVCLDLVFRSEPEISEWVAQARAGRAARMGA